MPSGDKTRNGENVFGDFAVHRPEVGKIKTAALRCVPPRKQEIRDLAALATVPLRDLDQTPQCRKLNIEGFGFPTCAFAGEGGGKGASCVFNHHTVQSSIFRFLILPNPASFVMSLQPNAMA